MPKKCVYSMFSFLGGDKYVVEDFEIQNFAKFLCDEAERTKV